MTCFPLHFICVSFTGMPISAAGWRSIRQDNNYSNCIQSNGQCYIQIHARRCIWNVLKFVSKFKHPPVMQLARLITTMANRDAMCQESARAREWEIPLGKYKQAFLSLSLSLSRSLTVALPQEVQLGLTRHQVECAHWTVQRSRAQTVVDTYGTYLRHQIVWLF